MRPEKEAENVFTLNPPDRDIQSVNGGERGRVFLCVCVSARICLVVYVAHCPSDTIGQWKRGPLVCVCVCLLSNEQISEVQFHTRCIFYTLFLLLDVVVVFLL